MKSIAHTNQRYFKDIVISDQITATTDLKAALDGVDAILFVVPTKVTRLVAKQVAETLDHPVTVMHASKGLEPGTHDRISQILEEEIPASLRSEVSGRFWTESCRGDHRTGHHPYYSSLKRFRGCTLCSRTL